MSWSTTTKLTNDTIQHQSQVQELVGNWTIALILLPRRKTETLTISP